MPFLTQEEVRAVRLKDSATFPIPGTSRSIRVLVMSGTKSLEMVALKDDLASGKRTQRDLFLFMVGAACADESGDLIAGPDAEQLLDVLSLDQVSSLVRLVNETSNGKPEEVKPDPSKASPADS